MSVIGQSTSSSEVVANSNLQQTMNNATLPTIIHDVIKLPDGSEPPCTPPNTKVESCYVWQCEGGVWQNTSVASNDSNCCSFWNNCNVSSNTTLMLTSTVSDTTSLPITTGLLFASHTLFLLTSVSQAMATRTNPWLVRQINHCLMCRDILLVFYTPM